MTRAIWDRILKKDYGRKYINGDMIRVTYRSNWTRHPEFWRIGRIWLLDELGVRFLNGKRLSYRSIIKMERIQ